MMDTEILNLINGFKAKKVLVLGDVMVDEFICGKSSRISPEAPVPIIEVAETNTCLGGAANVCANVSALGAKVYLCSVVGTRDYAKNLEPLLTDHLIDSTFLVRTEKRQTEIKTRLVAQGQTLIRYDSGDATPVSSSLEQELIEQLKKAYQLCDGVLIADYDKGIITATVLRALEKLQKQNPKFIAIDSKRLAMFSNLRPTLIKPNYGEMIGLLQIEKAEDRVAQSSELAALVLERTNAKSVAITLDALGVVWKERGKEVIYQPALSYPKPDVCGAGDTFISAASLALLLGTDPILSVKTANAAAAVVIKKTGTAVCSPMELSEHLLEKQKIITSPVLLNAFCQQWKNNGKRIVFTNGCFDILHRGHTKYLQEAKALGDILIVGINSDESVKRLKGSSRPINSLNDRMDVLAAFSCIDYIIPFGSTQDQDNPAELILQIRPDIVVKGEDYKGKVLPELKAVEAVGAKMTLLPFTYGKSTTNIIRKIQTDSEAKISSSSRKAL